MDYLFLDANVLFSIAYGSRSLGVFRDLARQGACSLIASDYVLEEARRNLSRREEVERLDQFSAALTITTEVDLGLPCPIVLPAKDRPVLLAAVHARATHLITGDLGHFGAYRGQTVQGVHICTPRDYLDLRYNG
ncbi:MAG TPA: PIN domain-containing protein [Spirochaetia bacterium]|nr:PIN domain-containing protein [Spirochaetia bacterium]